jgi:hypothetical protein
MKEEKIVLKNKLAFKDNDKWYSSSVSYHMKDNRFHVKSDLFKTPNISSHVLVDLCGLNKYASVGKTLLSMFGFAERQEIPLYQTVKGGIVEEFANQYLEDLYGGRYKIESFTLEQFAQTRFNQFPDQLPFSGALDKLIHGEIKLPVEIKSKEIREYEKIAIDKQYPKDQVVQGANQAFMYGAEKYMMLYGFLSKEISEYLKEITENDLWIWGKDYAQAIKDLHLKYEDIKFHHDILDYDSRIIKAYREKAQKIYNEFFTSRMIDRSLFKKEELEEIKVFIK